MRISDATFAERSDVTAKNFIKYRVIKTGRPIEIPPELQAPCVDALAKLPASRTYFFQPDREDDYRDARLALQTGDGEFSLLMPGYKRRVDAATRTVKQVLALAGVDGTCHSFRDTFAISLLTNGVDVFSVSKMLGHSDVKITDRHYLKLVEGYADSLSQKTRALVIASCGLKGGETPRARRRDAA